MEAINEWKEGRLEGLAIDGAMVLKSARVKRASGKRTVNPMMIRFNRFWRYVAPRTATLRYVPMALRIKSTSLYLEKLHM